MTYEHLVFTLNVALRWSHQIKFLAGAGDDEQREHAQAEINKLVAATGCSIDQYIDNLNAMILDIQEQRRDHEGPLSPHLRGYLEIRVPFPPGAPV